MLVQVTEGSEIVYEGKSYSNGEELDISGEILQIFINSGSVEIVKSHKEITAEQKNQIKEAEKLRASILGTDN